MHDFGSTIEQFALVSVKNHKHASHNPFAQLQNELTVEEIAHARMIADPLTVPHCCPMGDGAAAAVVVSEAKARQLGLRPPITVAASAFRSAIYEHGPPSEADIRRMQGIMPPAGYFAMQTRRRMHDFGSTIDQFALVSVKNHKNASHNPFAQLQNELTVEEIMNARMIADPLTVPHCCPMGDGAAAAVVVSEKRARQLGVRPLITVEASAFRSGIYENGPPSEAKTTHLTAQEAYAQAGLGPDDIDLVQVHDAFTVEEIEYCEQLGFCDVGEGERMIENGDTAISGRIPFSTDGGLLARGHPLGPTGLAQVWETVQQLRGLSGPRQVVGARVGLIHMVGVGGVCIIHLLKRY